MLTFSHVSQRSFFVFSAYCTEYFSHFKQIFISGFVKCKIVDNAKKIANAWRWCNYESGKLIQMKYRDASVYIEALYTRYRKFWLFLYTLPPPAPQPIHGAKRSENPFCVGNIINTPANKKTVCRHRWEQTVRNSFIKISSQYHEK